MEKKRRKFTQKLAFALWIYCSSKLLKAVDNFCNEKNSFQISIEIISNYKLVNMNPLQRLMHLPLCMQDTDQTSYSGMFSYHVATKTTPSGTLYGRSLNTFHYRMRRSVFGCRHGMYSKCCNIPSCYRIDSVVGMT